jgi:lactoylglutathione lyase
MRSDGASRASDKKGAPMKYCWTTINVTEIQKSLAFYEGLLGLKSTRRVQPAPGREIVFLGEGETQVELIFDAANKAPSFGKDISLGFVVESLERFGEVLKKHGIPVHSGPFQPNPFVKFIYILDPDGVKIQLVENIRQ